MKDIAMANKFEIFEKHKDTLMNLSFDSSRNEPMTASQLEAINFDKVKTAYLNSLDISEECAKSVDALLINSSRRVLIEFKNGQVKSNEIKTKIRDSLLIFSDIVGETISSIRNSTDFILVFNPENNKIPTPNKSGHDIQDSPNRERMIKYIFDKAEEEIVYFGLEKFIKFCFNSVHTYTKQEFEEYLSRN